MSFRTEVLEALVSNMKDLVSDHVMAIVTGPKRCWRASSQGAEVKARPLQGMAEEKVFIVNTRKSSARGIWKSPEPEEKASS